MSNSEINNRKDVLEEALKLTMGDRNRDYGEPYDNHRHVARIFTALSGKQLTAREAALFQVATKLARLANNPGHADSYIDAAAYLGITLECQRMEVGKSYGEIMKDEILKGPIYVYNNPSTPEDS